MKAPQRGEVWMVDLGMAAKVRPGLVLSVPGATFLKAGVFDAQSLVTIPHAKLIRRLGTLSAVQLSTVERAVCLWLGVPTASF